VAYRGRPRTTRGLSLYATPHLCSRMHETFSSTNRATAIPVTGRGGLVSRLSRLCGIFRILQTYRPSRPVTEIVLLVYMYMMFVPHRKYTYGPTHYLTGIALLVYM
jgi:hypothetical protein